MPLSFTRYSFTASARRTDSFLLYCSLPMRSVWPTATITSKFTPFSLSAKASRACLPSGLSTALSNSNSTSAEKLTFSGASLAGGGGGRGRGGRRSRGSRRRGRRLTLLLRQQVLVAGAAVLVFSCERRGPVASAPALAEAVLPHLRILGVAPVRGGIALLRERRGAHQERGSTHQAREDLLGLRVHVLLPFLS